MSGRIIEADHPQWTAWPRTVGRPDLGCDMLIGECACGTTHTVEQVAQAIVDHQISGDVEKATTHLLDIQRKQRADTDGAAQVQAREIARFAALVEQLKAERDAAREESKQRLHMWNEEAERIRGEREAALAELRERDEEIARLKDEHNRVSNALYEAKHEAGRPPQPLANYIKDMRAAHEREKEDRIEQVARLVDERRESRAAHAATTAKLGRAVAALQDARDHYDFQRDEQDTEFDRIFFGEQIARFDAILADADSAAAGEAHNALLREAMHMLCYVDAHMKERVAVAEKLAKASGHQWPPYPDAHDDSDCDEDCEKCNPVDARLRECGCPETYPQVQPGQVNHGPGCTRRGGGR